MYRVTLMNGQVVKTNKCDEVGSFVVCDNARYPITNVEKIETDNSGAVGAVIGGLILLGLGLG